MAALRPQLEMIANRHKAVIKACHDRLDALSDEQLKWSPDPAKTWSAVLVVDHLIKVHVATSPVLMKALQEAPAAGDEGPKEIVYGFFDRARVNMRNPDAKLKPPVPKEFKPTTHSATPHAVINRLYEEFEAFAVIVEYANDKRLKGVHVKSPPGVWPGGIIPFLEASVMHDRMYWVQIEALLRDPKMPK